jgi:hypothetical protein
MLKSFLKMTKIQLKIQKFFKNATNLLQVKLSQFLEEFLILFHFVE